MLEEITTAESEQPAVNVYTTSPGRIAASTAVMVGLIGAIVGGLALRRVGRSGTNGGRRGAIVALVLGPTSFVVGAIVVATARGGLGTGHGWAGGIVAMIVGTIGASLGALALVRSRATDGVLRRRSS